MSPNSLDPRSPREYRRRAAFVFVIGACAGAFGLAGFLDRRLLGTSSVGIALNGPVDELWLAAFTVGGAAIVAGWSFRRPEIEVIGDWLVMAALIVNALAIVAVRGVVGGGFTAIAVLGMAWAYWLRIGDLHTAARSDRRISDVAFDGPERRRA